MDDQNKRPVFHQYWNSIVDQLNGLIGMQLWDEFWTQFGTNPAYLIEDQLKEDYNE